MMQFRKKPVVISAVEWRGHNLREVINFTGLHESAEKWTWAEYEAVVKEKGLKIFTLEGPMMASVGDWIIKGVKGEFYACKPDIFAATYEPAAAQPSSTRRKCDACGQIRVNEEPCNDPLCAFVPTTKKEWVAIDSRGRTARMSHDERRFVDTDEGFIFDAGSQDRAEQIVRAVNAVPSAIEPASARWVPVAESIAMARINEVSPNEDIFMQAEDRTWYRLDCLKWPNGSSDGGASHG